MASLQIHRSNGPIGEGQFSEVFLAVDVNKDLKMAAKIFLPSCGDHADQIRHCKRELSVLQNIDHPNLLKSMGMIGSLEDTSSPPILLLHYAENGDLLDKIISVAGMGLAANEASIVLIGVCRGMEYLHEIAKVMHGDLKPENILLNKDMTPMIGDYDTALNIGAKVDDVMRGTADYHPPEYRSDVLNHRFYRNTTNSNNQNTSTGNGNATTTQISNDLFPTQFTPNRNFLVDASADVWAFGIICLAVFSGVHCWYLKHPTKAKYWLWRDDLPQSLPESPSRNNPRADIFDKLPIELYNLTVTSILAKQNPEHRILSKNLVLLIEEMPLAQLVAKFQSLRVTRSRSNVSAYKNRTGAGLCSGTLDSDHDHDDDEDDSDQSLLGHRKQNKEKSAVKKVVGTLYDYCTIM